VGLLFRYDPFSGTFFVWSQPTLFGLGFLHSGCGAVSMSDGVDPLEASRILDRFREQRLSGDPDWGPLEKLLPSPCCGGFMWMTRITQGEVVIELSSTGSPGGT
jgi:hypothetical protein